VDGATVERREQQEELWKPERWQVVDVLHRVFKARWADVWGIRCAYYSDGDVFASVARMWKTVPYICARGVRDTRVIIVVHNFLRCLQFFPDPVMVYVYVRQWPQQPSFDGLLGGLRRRLWARRVARMEGDLRRISRHIYEAIDVALRERLPVLVKDGEVDVLDNVIYCPFRYAFYMTERVVVFAGSR